MIAGGLNGSVVLDTHAAETNDAKWEEIQSIVSRYYGEWKDTSYSGAITDKMPNTALLGNSDVGITSGGNDTEKTFYVSKGDFWTYGTGNYGSPCPPILIGGITIGEQQQEQIITHKISNCSIQQKRIRIRRMKRHIFPKQHCLRKLLEQMMLQCHLTMEKKMVSKEQSSSR